MASRNSSSRKKDKRGKFTVATVLVVSAMMLFGGLFSHFGIGKDIKKGFDGSDDGAAEASRESERVSESLSEAAAESSETSESESLSETTAEESSATEKATAAESAESSKSSTSEESEESEKGAGEENKAPEIDLSGGLLIKVRENSYYLADAEEPVDLAELKEILKDFEGSAAEASNDDPPAVSVFDIKGKKVAYDALIELLNDMNINYGVIVE